MNIKVRTQRLFCLLKMDLHRLVRSKAFYVMLALCIVFPVMMFTSMKGNVGSAADMIAPTTIQTSGNPLSSMSGIAMLTIMTGIFLAIFIGTEYQTGFIKNIMTVHADKKEYILSKAVVAMIVTVSLIALYLVAISVVGAFSGMPLRLPSAGGFILLLLERIITSIAFTFMFIFLNVTFRKNYGFAILLSCVLGIGIVSMLLNLLSGLSPFFMWVNRLTVYGAGSYATLLPNGLTFLNILLVSAAWSALYIFLSSVMLQKRDLI